MVKRKTNPIEPIIKWPGGKRKLARQLIEMMPDHKCFVEVFFGGGGVFFSRPERAKCEVINDIKEELINLYLVVQQEIEGLLDAIQWDISSRSLFRLHKDADLTALSRVQRAARFLYLQQHAFGGKVCGQTFGTDTTRGGPNLKALRERLVLAHSRLNGVYIENLSWQDCIKRYDRAHTFYYLDPPYWQLTGYGVPFGWEQYQEMAAMMAASKGKMMLSINDHPDIKELFKSFRIEEIEVQYTIGRRNGVGSSKTSGELIICNY